MVRYLLAILFLPALALAQATSTPWKYDSGTQISPRSSSVNQVAVTGNVSVTDDAYDATSWNGSNNVPTKNAVRDKIEALSGGSGTPGGSNTQIQFNDSSAFGGDADLTWDKTNNYLYDAGRLGIGDATPDGTLEIEGTANTAQPDFLMTLPATTVAASTEHIDVDFNLSRTVTFSSGPLTTQRAMYIRSPTYTMSPIDTIDSAATFALSGPPAGTGAVNINKSAAFLVESRNVTSNVQDAVGLEVNAPTGAFGSNSAATFNGGAVGINTTSPTSYLDVRPTTLSSSATHTCLDGVSRIANAYIGGTQFAALGGTGNGTILDFGYAPSSNSSLSTNALNVFNVLGGSVNLTSIQRGSFFTLNDSGSGGTTTSSVAVNGFLQTSGSRAITTGRAALFNSSIGGTGTIASLPLVDLQFSYGDVAGTTTDSAGIRIGNPSKGASYTLTNFTGIDILDNTATVGTSKIGIRQRGTNYHNRFNGQSIFGADTTPTSGIYLEAMNEPAGITNNDNSANELRFYEPSTSGSNYTALKAQAQSGNVTYVLPSADSTGTQYLKSDGSGNLSWGTPSGGSSHALLDGSTHTDTVAQTVSRGSIIYGNSTPKWDELTVGSSGTVLKSDGTDVSWGVPSLSTAENCLSADVQMTTTGTFYDGGSVSLAAGTWFISAYATITRAATTAHNVTCKLWDGTTVESSTEQWNSSNNPHTINIMLNGLVSPGSTTSYKLSCTSTSGSSSLNLKAATPDSGSGNHATCTRAIRVG